MKTFHHASSSCRAAAILCAFACLGGEVSALAVERVWVGPDSGGLWNDAANWDPAGTMTREDIAVFRPSGELSLSVRGSEVSGSYVYAKGFRFESGSTFIGHDPALSEGDYRGYIRLKSGSDGAVFTNEVFVAAGATCVFSNACIAGSQKGSAILRTGEGELTLRGTTRWGNDWGVFTGWEFAAGTTTFDFDATYQTHSPVLIRSGAVLKSPHDYAFHIKGSAFEIEAGGVLDLNGAGTVYMAGFRGAGVITNANTITRMSLENGPYRFSGHLYPTASKTYVTLEFDPRDASYEEVDWKILLADENALSQACVVFPNSTGAPIGFASGTTSARIGQIRGNTDSTLSLEDEDGAPVALRTSFYNPTNMRLVGGGTLSGTDAVPTYSYAGNVLKQKGGLSISPSTGTTQGTFVVEDGTRLCVTLATANFTARDGGAVEIFNNPENNAGTWLFDGGALRLNPARAGYTLNATASAGTDQTLAVGPGGMTIRTLPMTGLYEADCNQFVFLRPITASDDDAANAGGVTRLGGGFVFFYQPLAIRGAFANLDGTLRLPNQTTITAATAPLFGTGDFRLGNARFEYSGGISTAFTARLGTGGRFLYDGAATMRVRESVNRPVQTLELGELTRGSAGAALYFWDNSSGLTYNGSGTKVTFTTAPATTADGRIEQPVFTYAGNRFDFAAYTADGGLKAFEDYAAWSTADATKTTRTPSSVTHVTSDKAVAALRVDGINGIYGSGGSPLWIDADATLTIGAGTAPACLILNAADGWAPSRIRGAGTLSFGGREGVIVANNRASTEAGQEFAGVYSRIADADGLTITRAALLGGDQGVVLGADNAYSGTTRVFGTRVMPRAAGAFGTSVVEIGAGELQGGTLRLDVEGLTVANDIRVSGWGARAGSDSEGAITFAASATLTGAVEAYGETRVVALDGTRGVFAGAVSGEKIWIWKGAGEVCFAAANTCTGGVEVVGSTLVLTDAGTPGTGDVRLNGGTLVFENEAEKTVANKVCGRGTIRISGAGAVRLPARASEDGVGFTLDVEPKVATISSLKDIASITTPRTGSVALIVEDGDIASFAGTKPENVTLYRPGDNMNRGMILIIR